MTSKWLFLMVFFFLFGILQVNAREHITGNMNLGIPIADFNDNHTFNLQGNFYHFWSISNTACAGPTLGVMFFIEDDTLGSSKPLPAFYIPIAASGDVKLSYRLRLKLSFRW